MPSTPFVIPSDDDAIFGWKTGGGGGGNTRFNPPGTGVGGTAGGAGGGGGPLGFDYANKTGFDPYGDQRRRAAMAFGRGPQRMPMQGGQQLDPQMLQRLLAMMGGGF